MSPPPCPPHLRQELCPAPAPEQPTERPALGTPRSEPHELLAASGRAGLLRGPDHREKPDQHDHDDVELPAPAYTAAATRIVSPGASTPEVLHEQQPATARYP